MTDIDSLKAWAHRLHQRVEWLEKTILPYADARATTAEVFLRAPQCEIERLARQLRSGIDAVQRVEAQLAAREGEIATLKEENDELTRRVMMAEQQPRSAASTSETAPCDCTRHRHCPRCHGAGCISDGPNYSHCIECGHEWRHDQPEASDARPTPVEEGTATGSATQCLSCAALTVELDDLKDALASRTADLDESEENMLAFGRLLTAAGARADTAEAQLRAQEQALRHWRDYALGFVGRVTAETSRLMNKYALTSAAATQEAFHRYAVDYRPSDVPLPAPPITQESQP